MTQPDAGTSFAVFDIDGVLADVTHRLRHLRGVRKRWDRFFAEAAGDPLLEEGHQRVMRAAQEHALVYLSGRPERLRELTQTWLDGHALPTGALMLRPDRDRRPARLLKLDLLARLAAHGEIAFVVDDDAEVCRALRGAGLTVQHATWAPQPPDLRDAQERQGRS